MRTHSLFAPLALFVGALAAPALARGATLTVGPGMMYATPSAAAAAAHDGDIVEIAAGTYRDVAQWRANGLTLRGVGGRAHLDAAGLTIPNGKAIWVISGNDTTVENVEFSGAQVPDANGAGIRQEGAGLTVHNCYFHDNQDGILAGDNATSDIVIEGSEFAHNGAGDGQSHNMYINHVRTFTLRGSYSHAAHVGHLVKSRAFTTYLLYNRITGEDGDESYEVDLPDGGLAILVGNLIQQGAATQNPTIVTFAEEHQTNPMQALYVVNNTVVNDRTSGGTFVRVVGTPTASVVNNLFIGPGTAISGTATMMANRTGMASDLVNAAGFDYHLAAGSPAINAGVDPGSAGSFALSPTLEYQHPTATVTRMVVGSALDQGAYEYGNVPSDGGVGTDASSGSDAATDASAGSDAAPGTDGAAGTDAGSHADAGARDGAAEGDGGTGGDHGGCGCRAAGGAGGARGAALGVLLAAGLLARGRRRRRC